MVMDIVVAEVPSSLRGNVEKCSERRSSLVHALARNTSNCPQEIDFSCGELISSLWE